MQKLPLTPRGVHSRSKSSPDVAMMMGAVPSGSSPSTLSKSQSLTENNFQAQVQASDSWESVIGGLCSATEVMDIICDPIKLSNVPAHGEDTSQDTSQDTSDLDEENVVVQFPRMLFQRPESCQRRGRFLIWPVGDTQSQ